MKEESLLLLSDLQKLINQVVLIDYTIIILGGEFMDEAKKLIVLEQENEELKRELRELFKTLDQMNQSLNRMIDHYILCKTEKAG